MNIDEKIVNIIDLKKGIKMILTAFSEQKAQYLKIINSMKEKIILLEEQIIKLKDENKLYQNKLFSLQKNIKYISKTICQLKDDEETNAEKNTSYMNKYDKSSSIDQDKTIKIKLTKDKNNEFFKRNSINKLEMKLSTILDKKNNELNNYYDNNNKNSNKSIGNEYTNSRDDDIQIKKKEKNDINNIYNFIKNKKRSFQIESKSSNQTNENNNFKEDLESKSYNEITDN